MTHRLVISICVLAALALASCGGGGGDSPGTSYTLATSPSPTAGAGTGTTMSGADAALAQAAVDWINAHRQANGFAALPWNAAIAQTGRDHSEDMFTRTFFDHVNPDGDDPGDRLAADGIVFTGWAENIASGQPTGQAVAEAWMASDGHRANILSGNWTSIGVGAYTNGGVTYWTNMFHRN